MNVDSSGGEKKKNELIPDVTVSTQVCNTRRVQGQRIRCGRHKKTNTRIKQLQSHNILIIITHHQQLIEQLNVDLSYS